MKLLERKHLRISDVNSASVKPLIHFEQLEPRILLSGDSLLNIAPNPQQDTILDNTSLTDQYAELLDAQEQVEEFISPELTSSGTSDTDVCKPIFTLSVYDDNTNDSSIDKDLSIDNMDSARLSSKIALLDGPDGDTESKVVTTENDDSKPTYIDADLSKEYSTSIKIRGPSASETIALSGIHLVDPTVDNINGQSVYLDFDGEQNVTYNGPVTIEGIDVPAFLAPGDLAGQEQVIITKVLGSLEHIFAGSDVIFTRERSFGNQFYSTIYVGGDDSAFAEYGSFLGLAEQVDVGNMDGADAALVFNDHLIRDTDDYDVAMRLADTTTHEIGHLLGFAHDEACEFGWSSPLTAHSSGASGFYAFSLVETVVADIAHGITYNGTFAHSQQPLIEHEPTKQASYHGCENTIVTSDTLGSIETCGLPTEIVFIDSALEHDFQLKNAFQPDVLVSVLPADTNGILHISNTLSGFQNVSAIHIITHGTSGQLLLGTGILSPASLDDYADCLAVWGEALKDDGDILIYGCSVAQGGDGRTLISRIAELTGVDVAASTNPTGANELGGDWLLEYSSGPIGLSQLGLDILPNYEGLLNWTQVSTEIDGAAAGDYCGTSVAMSADGGTIIIGAWGNDANGSNSGHARIFEYSGDIWMQKGTDIVGDYSDDYCGDSVAISADGNTIIVGAYGNDRNGSDSGHARIYEFSGGNWVKKGEDINGEAAGDYFSSSVAMSADGNTVIIGATGNDGNGDTSGHARVYEFNSGTWVQKGSDIDGEAAGDYSGGSVAMSADGSTVIIGATGNDGNGDTSGHARVYEFSGDSWIQKGADIDGEANFDYSGDSVAMSTDGNTIIVGARNNDGNGSNSGHARVYEFSGGAWVQKGADIDGEAADDRSGSSVAISADGSIVIIGAYENDGNGWESGHARVYEFSTGSWIQKGSDIDGEAAADYSGSCVAISADGTIVIIGAPYNDGNGSNSGHARVYEFDYPEITVWGNGIVISDEDSTPSTTDHTDFGSVTQGSSSVSRTFTVSNDGGSILTLGSVTVPTGFTLAEGLSNSLAVGASDTFTVWLDTAVAGIKSGDVYFSNNDPDENSFNFRITGTVVAPKIDVELNGTDDVHAYAFGIVQVGRIASQEFTARNEGDADLIVSQATGIDNPFSIIPVNGSDSTDDWNIHTGVTQTFTVSFSSDNPGDYSDTLILTSNDSDEGSYEIIFTGTADMAPVVQNWDLIEDSGNDPEDKLTNDTTPQLIFIFSETVFGQDSDVIILDPNSSPITPDSITGWASDTVIITFNSPLVVDGEYTVTLNGTSTIEDGVGNPLNGGADEIAHFTLDTIDPVVTVDSLLTSDTTPPLTGTVNDADASIEVTVDGSSYAAVNNGNGTWTLADDNISPALADGNYDVAVTATDLAGNISMDSSFNELTVSSQLRVNSLEVLPGGFVAHFNRQIDPYVLNLYDNSAGIYGPADVTIVGDTVGPVAGSLICSEDGTIVSFIKTGGTLEPDTYTLTLRSGADAFKDTEGHLLDGDDDGVEGGDYIMTVTVEPTTARLLSLPDFTRGPGQDVNVPATDSGIPLTISDGNNVQTLDFVFEYAPDLLNVTGMSLDTDVPGDWNVVYNRETPGQIPITASGTTPLSVGEVRLLDIQAATPNDAVYASSAVFRLSSIQINEGTIETEGDSSVQVVAYFGDATGNQTYSGLDAAYIARVAIGFDSGFAAYRLKDPVIVADVTGNGHLSGLDAAYVARKAIGFEQPQIPDLPNPLPEIVAGGRDPLLSIPENLTTKRGSTITIPILVDDATNLSLADIDLQYDTNVFDLSNSGVNLVDLTTDWDLIANVDDAEGRVRLSTYSATPLSGDFGSIVELEFNVRSDAALGVTAINPLKSCSLNEGALVLTLQDGEIVIKDATTIPTLRAWKRNDKTGISLAGRLLDLVGREITAISNDSDGEVESRASTIKKGGTSQLIINYNEIGIEETTSVKVGGSHWTRLISKTQYVPAMKARDRELIGLTLVGYLEQVRLSITKNISRLYLVLRSR